jgi:O-antigen/teichoic acid export membrane protein
MAAGYNIARKGLIIPRFALRGYSEFLTFGGFLTGSRILWYFYSMSDIFVGGRYLSNKLLGVYSVAMQLATIPIEKIMPIISQVAFPAYSRIQSETERVRSHFIKSVRLLSFIIFPVYGGLFLIAPQMVNLFLGHKWGEIILPISLLCLIMPFRSLSTLFPPLLNGLGRPDVDFVNVTMASLILPAAFLIGVRKGILGICFAWIIGYSFVFAIASIRSLRVLGIKYNAYISSIIMPIISTLAMIIAVRLFALVAGHYLSSILQLILYVLLGMLFYLAAMFMTRRSAIIEVLSIIRKR